MIGRSELSIIARSRWIITGGMELEGYSTGRDAKRGRDRISMNSCLRRASATNSGTDGENFADWS